MLDRFKIKLATNTTEYWETIEKLHAATAGADTIPLTFQDWELYKFDLRDHQYPVTLYARPLGVYNQFLHEQYAYTSSNTTIRAKPGDVVLDCGGCYGDTALYFATRVGSRGTVYSFEFVPSNIRLWLQNVQLNPGLSANIKLVQQPLSDASGQELFYQDFGPATAVRSQRATAADGIVKTLSIDDFVDQNHVPRVDFINMDVEGAEEPPLKGANNVLKTYKPRLAIAIYHSVEQFCNLFEVITSLNLGYKLYLGHHTIHAEETILYAEVPDK